MFTELITECCCVFKVCCSSCLFNLKLFFYNNLIVSCGFLFFLVLSLCASEITILPVRNNYNSSILPTWQSGWGWGVILPPSWFSLNNSKTVKDILLETFVPHLVFITRPSIQISRKTQTGVFLISGFLVNPL